MKDPFPPVPVPARVSAPLKTEHLRLRSALWDRTTGFASFHFHLDELRALLDDRRSLALLLVACGELGLLESLYGWQVLDRVMRKATERIAALRGNVLSGRAIVALNGVAGEEILIFEPGEREAASVDPESAAKIAAEVSRSLDEAFGSEDFAAMEPKLSFRVGTSIVEENPQFRFERIVYRAIEQARTQQARREERHRAEWDAQLQRLIRDKTVEVLYQPIVRLDTLAIEGFEAFCRGQEGAALRSSGMLFAIAVRLGVSRELDRVCRYAALSHARSLSGGASGRGGQGGARLRLFLNTRPESLSDPDWGSESLARVLADQELSAADVVLDVPEGGLANREPFPESLARLRARGFSIALDAVGTGYSTVLAAERFRPDYLKVDLSLVHQVDRSLLKQEVVSSILKIASRIGARVIAVGIETAEELDLLRECGVHLGQGHLFAPPSSALSGERMRIRGVG